MYRSRSNPSSATSSFHPRHAEITSNLSLKRVFTSNSFSSSSDDSWHQGKRRRRDNLNLVQITSEKRFGQFQCENRIQVDQASNFATTSAQFNLFPRTGSSAGKTRRLKTTSEAKLAHERQHSYLPDLVHLRSSAFWELRQSIADNGEGLVRRMRDYERSRSKTHHKAKEAEKRGRKRLCPRKKRALVDTSDASEDEDIQICFGKSENHIPRGNFLGKRAASLDSMDVDAHHTEWPTITQHARNRTPSSSPDTRYTTSSPALESDDESSLNARVAELLSVSPRDSSQGSAPSLSYSPGESACSSLVSLPLPSSTVSEPYLLEPLASNPSTASEKAIAALNLAFANGAGSISDYSSVRQYQEIFQTQSYDNGDLWH